MMKRIITGIILFQLLISCCDGDFEYNSMALKEPPLEIYVIDGNHTRSIQSGLAFSFSDGDRVGVFKVSEDGVVVATNVVFTLNNGQWTTTGDITFDSSCTYYAYYPASGTANAPSVGSLPQLGEHKGGTGFLETEFFDAIISAWTPNTDQSTQEKYTKSDLMVSLGFIENGKIHFPMRHQMALARLSLGSTTVSGSGVVYKIDNGYYWAEKKAYASTSWLNGRKLLKNDSYYYYLVNPLHDSVTLGGADDSEDFDNSWSQVIDGLSAGVYKDYTVNPKDQTINVNRNYTVSRGDVFYNDGSLSHKDDPILNNKTPIGIVVLCNSDISEVQGALETKYDSRFSHGLVMALKDVPDGGRWAVSSSSFGDESYDTNGVDSFTGIGTTSMSKMRQMLYGLEATLYLSNGTCGHTDHEAHKKAVSFTPSPPSFLNTPCSNWFIPAVGQWAAIIDANAEYYLTWPSLQYSVSWIEYEKDELNKVILDSNGNPIVKSTEARDKIVASFRTIESFFTTQLVETVSDAVMIQDNVAYWLSSEYTAQGDNYCNAAIVGVFSATSVQRNAQIFKQTKYYTLPIRPILAF